MKSKTPPRRGGSFYLHAKYHLQGQYGGPGNEFLDVGHYTSKNVAAAQRDEFYEHRSGTVKYRVVAKQRHRTPRKVR